MSYLKAPSSAIKETTPSSTDKYSGPIPMSAEVQAEPCVKPNKRGKTPTIGLIQRGVDGANLTKTELTKLEKSVSKANRGEVYWPTAKIKDGLKGDMELLREGLNDLIALTVTDTKPAKPAKPAKAAATKPAKAAKAPKETPKDEPKADEPKAKKQSLAQRKMAAIEALVAQNAEIISLLK